MNTLDWAKIQKGIIEKVKSTNSNDPVAVSNMLTSLEEYLRVPYNTPQFYMELQKALGYLASNHALLVSGPQVEANVRRIRSLLETIVSYLNQLHGGEDPRSITNTNPILNIMNEEGEEITDISDLHSGTMFVLASKQQLVNMFILVKGVLKEEKKLHTVEKTLVVSQWNPNTATWEVMAGERSLLQTVVAGKPCVIYSDSFAKVLQLTENQRALVNGEMQIAEEPAPSGEMNPATQKTLSDLGETYDPKNR